MHQAPTDMTVAAAGPRAGQGYLSLQGLTKRYHDFLAVEAIDLDVAQGEFVALLGPSGCGKTTTLRMIAGLVPTSGGRIVVAGQDLTAVPPHKRDMGLVFQSYALFPHMTIAQNVAFGLEMRRLPRMEIAARVAEAVAMVRLEGREDRRPAQLSGGQQQRVALARALVVRPSILLFDEPLSNLDAKLREEMRSEIREIQQRLGTTALFVTHDQDEALTMSDRIVVMSHGRIEQIGRPEDLYERPATPFVARFVGRTNRFTGNAHGTTIRLGDLAVRAATQRSGPVEVMIRPHRVALAAAGCVPADGLNSVTGIVRRTTYSGDFVQYLVDADGLTFMVEEATVGHGRIAPAGTAVTLTWAPADTLVYEAAP
nr:ABC transporter ATP-binding protein [Mongoliimonas terrestris]